MILIGIGIYKKSNKKSTINLVFAILFFMESFIIYSIIRDFDYDSDH